ncbi:hypothetical protein [Streptomyces sp. MJM1172]|uniref:hypothetical protein n=1 Tax=Streptomyces sp. MJM1172 TaxID=1703926 RepID=UPI00093C1927|nr:hypothetical protein [Streptomyces sp. MJM1172]OKI50323.1 hypothetical protein AMK15_32720 [Streptomyces sp. MJM1172]
MDDVDVEDLRIAVYRALQLAGLPLSDLPAPPGPHVGEAGGVDVVEAPELGAVIVGWACSEDLIKQAAAALDQDDESHRAVQLQGKTEAAMGAALAQILQQDGFVTRPRADVPGSHQLVVTKES